MAILVILLSIALVVALIVLVIVLGRGGSDAPDPAPGAASGAAVGGAAEDEAGDGGNGGGAAGDQNGGDADAPARYEAELVEIDLDGGMTYVDLDTEPPTVSETEIGGHDLILGTTSGTPGLYSQDSVQMTLAPLPDGGAEPDPESCRDAVETNGTYTSDFEQDARFCLQTDAGAIAAVEVTASPHGRGAAAFEATLWE